MSLADEPDHQLLVSISDRYMLEKDLDGDLTETLDLKCLLSIKADDTQHDAASHQSQIIELNFDYIKKNRRQRRYVMEWKDSEVCVSLI